MLDNIYTKKVYLILHLIYRYYVQLSYVLVSNTYLYDRDMITLKCRILLKAVCKATNALNVRNNKQIQTINRDLRGAM